MKINSRLYQKMSRKKISFGNKKLYLGDSLHCPILENWLEFSQFWKFDQRENSWTYLVRLWPTGRVVGYQCHKFPFFQKIKISANFMPSLSFCQMSRWKVLIPNIGVRRLFTHFSFDHFSKLGFSMSRKKFGKWPRGHPTACYCINICSKSIFLAENRLSSKNFEKNRA